MDLIYVLSGFLWLFWGREPEGGREEAGTMARGSGWWLGRSGGSRNREKWIWDLFWR